jgi:hypothetical protein
MDDLDVFNLVFSKGGLALLILITAGTTLGNLFAGELRRPKKRKPAFTPPKPS